MTDEDIERLRRSLDLGIHITNHRQVRGKRREADAAARFLVGVVTRSAAPAKTNGCWRHALGAARPDQLSTNGTPVDDFVIEQHDIGESHPPSP